MHAPKCLTIAGSDPSGGAGVQGDLKTFCALDAYGMAAITALTVQNSRGVASVHPVEADLVYRQVRAVLEDVSCDVIKIGMLGSMENVRAVARALREWPLIPVVLDPVLVSSSGARLLPVDGTMILKDELLPLAAICTPNRAEAEELTGIKVTDDARLRSAAEQLHESGAKGVLITGADSNTHVAEILDAWYDETNYRELRHPRIPTPHTRGTGCALAAAISVNLARGHSPIDAVTLSREFVLTRLKGAVQVGLGRGPVNHLLLE